jgi:hypothetical protein
MKEEIEDHDDDVPPYRDQLVADALLMAVWRRGSRGSCCITPIKAAK